MTIESPLLVLLGALAIGGFVGGRRRRGQAGVRARWPLPKSVRYEELTAWEWSVDNPPVARWSCADCHSILCVRSGGTDGRLSAGRRKVGADRIGSIEDQRRRAGWRLAAT